jgi:arsenite methyltransferase
MSKCADCRLFQLENSGNGCIHLNRPGGLALTAQVMDLCHLPEGARILDVGCGASATMQFLTEKMSLHATGMDLSREQLQRGNRAAKDLSLVQAAADLLPFPSGTEDAVLSECSLSLMGNLEENLGEVRRVLRPGGKLALTDIYIRQIEHLGDMECLSASRCLAGAMQQSQIISTLERHGFQIRTWQDQTVHLKQWLARMVFSLGSLNNFYRLLASDDAGAGKMVEQLGQNIKLGYYALVAEKM